MDDLAGKIPMVIDGGQCSFGIESTVVDGLRVPPAILRPGGVTYEQIRKVKGMEGVQVYKKHFTDAAMEQAPTTPGMKYRHYSPEAEVVLVEYGTSSASGSSSSESATTAQYGVILREIERLKKEGKHRFGILRTSFTSSLSVNGSISRPAHDNKADPNPSEVIEFPLGQGSKPEDVARELFRGLRYLDGQKVDCIFVEGISEDDEGLAVMNRLRKAASRTIS
jgi:L-threonylcarbamoyladenylate synthase